MSYREAIEDGIEIVKNSKGFNTYFIPCHICGESVPNWAYNRKLKYTCEKCRDKLIEKSQVESKEKTKDKKLNWAINRIKKVANIKAYDNAITEIKKELYKKGLYQSTEEIMVGIELKKRNVEYLHQFKLKDYKLDFVIPSFKVVLEVDGIFHTKEKLDKEELRDEIIKFNLGDDWEIIHIKTENININVTRLIPAIKEVKKYRNKHKT